MVAAAAAASLAVGDHPHFNHTFSIYMTVPPMDDGVQLFHSRLRESKLWLLQIGWNVAGNSCEIYLEGGGWQVLGRSGCTG